MNVGLFFGSFNPIHVGHLIIADAILNRTDLEKIIFVVSPQNPFKSSSSLAHEFDRYDMVRKAIFDNEQLDVSDVEFHMPRPSYTVDTLAYLSDKYRQDDFSIIMGADNLSHFHKWKNHEEILKHHKVYVYPRPQAKESRFENHEKIIAVEAPLIDISATYIRESLKQGYSVRYLLHPEVITHIEAKKMYV